MAREYQISLCNHESASGPSWDQIVQAGQGGTVFHTSSWFTSSPHKFTRLIVKREERPVAGVMFQDECGNADTSATLAPYLGPFWEATSFAGLDDEERRAIMRALARAINTKFAYSEFFVSPWFGDIREFLCNGFRAEILYTTVVDVTDLAKTYDGFSRVLKSNLRTAVRTGLEVDDEGEVGEVLRLVEQSFARQNKSIWFRIDEANGCINALRADGRARCFITRDRASRPIAAVCIVWDDQRSYYLLGGYDHECKHRGAVSAAMWQAIRFTAETIRLPYFDLEGTHVPSIERFFRQFNGIYRPYYYVTPRRP